jgi:hypothetical protein
LLHFNFARNYISLGLLFSLQPRLSSDFWLFHAIFPILPFWLIVVYCFSILCFTLLFTLYYPNISEEPCYTLFLPECSELGFFSTSRFLFSLSNHFQVKLPKQFSSLSDPSTVNKERLPKQSSSFQVSPNITEVLFAVLFCSF